MRNVMCRRMLAACFGLVAVGLAFGAPAVEVGSGRIEQQRFDLRGFTGIETSGSWGIEVREGSYSVVVRADDNVMDNLRVQRRDDRLHLGLELGSYTRVTLEATISMPDLRAIDLSGSAEVTFSGFDQRQFAIAYSGSSTIIGRDCRIESLTIDGSGSGSTDLSACRVENAEVELSGSSNVQLAMTGGRLTGGISGSGTITYSGDVREQDVSTSGSGRVRKVSR